MLPGAGRADTAVIGRLPAAADKRTPWDAQMTLEAWFTVCIIALVTAVLASNKMVPEVVMMGGLTALLIGDALAGGILPPEKAFAGFAHPAVVMIGALFVVAAGLTETGGLARIAQYLLGRPRRVLGAQVRMMVPVAILSGFMNNTPIVVMYLPIINDWAKRLRISPSKLYMPLSFAALLGGKITLIGTASNVVVMGLYMSFVESRLAREASGEAEAWLQGLGVEPLSGSAQFWAVGALGLPTTLIGIGLILVTSRWLLPERRPVSETVVDARRYQAEMRVQPNSSIVGKSIEEAGLRHLPGLYLTQIERAGEILHAVDPDAKLAAGDTLYFAGILESVVDLRKIRGLVPATDQVEKVRVAGEQRTLVEAVVARNSPLVGKTVRESRFRTTFNAAIIAVHRNGERIRRKIGDIVLRPGDTLLLDTHAGFVDSHRNSDTFYLVSNVAGSTPPRHERASFSLGVLVLLVALLTLSPLPPVVAALVCAAAMVLGRGVAPSVAHEKVAWPILIVIGAALGMGESLTHTGAAQHIAEQIMAMFAGSGPRTMLLVMFTLTMLFAQLITSYGAAVLMFPITMVTSEALGVNPEPFLFTLMVAAGSTYLSPVAYQTNLMVYGPGGYRFLDYMRLGLPLVVAIGITCTVLAPALFPLR